MTNTEAAKLICQHLIFDFRNYALYEIVAPYVHAPLGAPKLDALGALIEEKSKQLHAKHTTAYALLKYAAYLAEEMAEIKDDLLDLRDEYRAIADLKDIYSQTQGYDGRASRKAKGDK